MLLNLLILLTAIFVIIKASDFAIIYSSKLAEGFRLSKYTIGFLIVAVISILPEMMIAINSALDNVPAFGLGALYGSNVADLSLVFALVIFFSQRNLKVESKIIKTRFLHIGIMAIPLILGLNGYYSRVEGIFLIMVGLCFYLYVLKNNSYKAEVKREPFAYKNLFWLLISMGLLLLGANFAVEYGVKLASNLQISPVFVGMFIVGLGTVLPELMFSLRAARNHHDQLALGDILGTVIADATIVVGLIAVINPFSFSRRLVYVTGFFMFLAIILLFSFMKSDRKLTKKEAFLLLLFYISFIIAELLSSGLE